MYTVALLEKPLCIARETLHKTPALFPFFSKTPWILQDLTQT